MPKSALCYELDKVSFSDLETDKIEQQARCSFVGVIRLDLKEFI